MNSRVTQRGQKLVGLLRDIMQWPWLMMCSWITTHGSII